MKGLHHFPCCLAVLFLGWISIIDAEYHEGLFRAQDTIYVWSDEKQTANTARQTCVSSGGNLLRPRNESDKVRLMTAMQQKYNKATDLATITIYKNPNFPNRYKYRSTVKSRDKADIQDWKMPEGELRSFTLYSRKFNGFNQTVTFCYLPGKDSVVHSTCNGKAQIKNFQLYSGTSDTHETIPLHAYHNADQTFSKLFLSEDDPSPPFVYSRWTMYIPDNSVFIEARSDINQKSWFWGDRTPVNDTKYQDININASVCQQMSWPLTYDNGINLFPKQCDVDEAYFACEIKFIPTLTSVPCEPHKLYLSWNSAMFDGILHTIRDIKVTIELLQSNRPNTTVLFNESKFIIDGLSQKTKYSVQVTLHLGIYSGFDARTTVTAHTPCDLQTGIFSLVASNADEEPGVCLINWNYVPSDKPMNSLMISTKNMDPSLTLLVQREYLSNASNTTQTLIDLTSHGNNRTIQCQIQSNSRSGEHEMTIEVTGDCKVLPKHDESSFTTKYVIAIGVSSFFAGVFIILCGHFITFRMRKRKPSKSNYNMDVRFEGMPREAVTLPNNDDQGHYEEINTTADTHPRYVNIS